MPKGYREIDGTLSCILGLRISIGGMDVEQRRDEKSIRAGFRI